MEKKMKVEAWGCTVEVWCVLGEYESNGTLAVQLFCEEGPFASLTVNVEDGCAGGDYAYVDTNNCPWAQKFIAENGLGETTGIVGFSGRCQYPLYLFHRDRLKESANGRGSCCQ